ncbi:MAG: 3-deoxy-D-manno-octulosonic acid transferase, partial [Spirosomaceae bacterium]|nr:3-deoxy-D-manno-octulosonic acid transferase [Spirosomataceae bacterium]
VSAIFRPNQLFFKSYGGFYRKMLFCFDHIFVQNQASQQLLARVGCTSVTLAGDTRLDRVAQIAQQARPLPEIAAFKGNDPLLVVGSAWPDDMERLIPFLNRWAHPLKVLIAPHEINPAQIEIWRKQLRDSVLFTESASRRSEADKKQLPPNLKNPNVMFLDTVGMLAATYQYADFVYIGGAFGDGLHNILEPAAFGMPLFFGKPHYDKFQEAHDLLALGAATSVGTAHELEEVFVKVYQQLDERQRQAAICRAYIQHHLGATEKVLRAVREDFCI